MEPAVSESALGPVDVAVLCLYFVLIAGITVGVSRHQARSASASASATDTYFLADRSVAWWAVAASLFASNIGSEHFIGLAGSAAASGVAVAWYEIGAVPVMIFAGSFFLPIYLHAGVQTTPDYLEKRYSAWCRTVVVVVSLCLYVFSKVSATLFAGQLILVQLIHVEKAVAVVLLVSFTALYTLLGGLEAVIYTEALQTLVLLAGGVMVLAFSLTEVGGWGALLDKVAALDSTGDDFMHMFRSPADENYPWTGFAFGYFCIAPWYWSIVQRALAAQNVAHGKLGYSAAAALKFLPFFIMVVPGLCARVLVSERLQGDALDDFVFDLSYPWLVLNVVPRNARGIILASMLSSLMSALASVFNSSATLFTLNVWRPQFPGSSERQLVLVGRCCVVGMAVLALLWVPVMPLLGSSLFIITQKPPAYLAPPILALYLWGMLSRVPTRKAGRWTLAGGTSVGAARFVAEIVEEASGRQLFGAFTRLNFLHFAAVSFLLCTVALFSLSLSLCTCACAGRGGRDHDHNPLCDGAGDAPDAEVGEGADRGGELGLGVAAAPKDMDKLLYRKGLFDVLMQQDMRRRGGARRVDLDEDGDVDVVDDGGDDESHGISYGMDRNGSGHGGGATGANGNGNGSGAGDGFAPMRAPNVSVEMATMRNQGGDQLLHGQGEDHLQLTDRLSLEDAASSSEMELDELSLASEAPPDADRLSAADHEDGSHFRPTHIRKSLILGLNVVILSVWVVQVFRFG